MRRIIGLVALIVGLAAMPLFAYAHPDDNCANEFQNPDTSQPHHSGMWGNADGTSGGTADHTFDDTPLENAWQAATQLATGATGPQSGFAEGGLCDSDGMNGNSTNCTPDPTGANGPCSQGSKLHVGGSSNLTGTSDQGCVHVSVSDSDGNTSESVWADTDGHNSGLGGGDGCATGS